jgi:hypothetical protein
MPGTCVPVSAPRRSRRDKNFHSASYERMFIESLALVALLFSENFSPFEWTWAMNLEFEFKADCGANLRRVQELSF